MKVLQVSGLYDPHFGGGAEYSALALRKALEKRGHEVAVVTTCSDASEISLGGPVGRVRMWRYKMPRPYAVGEAAPAWKRIIWHLMDHFDPRNRWFIRQAIRQVKPDVAVFHCIQGLGHNIVREFKAHNIPILYFLHDLGLVCLRRSMFRNGATCATQCASCSCSMRYQRKLLSGLGANVTFCSPSIANLQRINGLYGFEPDGAFSLLNTNEYPQATKRRGTWKGRRIIYVGRLHHTKGVEVLIEACRRARTVGDFSLTIVGDGPDGAMLREKHASDSWITFKGHLSHQQISDLIVQHDALCIPSLWEEILGGVVIHALMLGTPVIGSNKGGIPQLIEHGRNGLLVEAGNVDAWSDALASLAGKNLYPGLLAYAQKTRDRFNPETLGDELERLVRHAATR